MRKTQMAALAAALLAAGAARAQSAEKRTITLEGARIAVAAFEAEARRNGAAGAIAVVDDGGTVVAVSRLDGTFPKGSEISVGKARTAAMFRKPTSVFEKIIRDGRTPMLALNDFTPMQGGVPIEVGGQVIGAVGVAGASSAQQDEDFAVVAAKAVAEAGPAASSTVLSFDAAKVKAAFEKGAVLVGEAPGRNYQIHASRREAPGQGEVHEHETDLIYVQGGTATFVTGGKLVDPKTVAPNEVRGSGIAGGESHALKQGDVIIVPKGVPHWFREVQAPFTYYVVKVR